MGLTTTNKRLTRSEVPEHLTWDLSDLFSSREQWLNALESLLNSLPTVTSFKGTLGENAENLLNCLIAYENFHKQAVLVFTYASLRLSADGSDPLNQSDAGKVGTASAQISAELSFIKSEILQLDETIVRSFIQEKPELEMFNMTLNDILAEKPYTLSPETEKVLAALSEVHSAPYTIYNRSKSSDMQFDSITTVEEDTLPMSFALYEDKYEISPNITVRRKAYESFVKTLNQYKNTFAATYGAEVKKQVTLAKLRNYPSVTDMLLHPQKVTKDMYHNQIDIIKNELAPYMRKFARLKKEVLGLDELRFCDLKAPLDPDFNPSTTYEEAKALILDSLSIMGEEYLEIMKKALNERWVDLADNIGKSTGAFCSSPYGSHPYILITWTDSMRSAFVLAHELGHAGHFYLAGKNQSLLNTRPSTYFVEAPSTMNELLLARHLLNKTDNKQMRRWVILQVLGTYYHNFITHLLEAEYQRKVYDWAEKGNTITANVLCKFKGETLKEFWGDEVEFDEGASLTWMRQPHYYMGLYPYTYSAGLTISTAVASKLHEDPETIVKNWLEVLKAGGTLTPLELAKKAGVDMSNPEPIREAVKYVGALVEELIELYK